MALLGANKRIKTFNRALSLKTAVEKLQRSLTFPTKALGIYNASRYELPEDVKKGHFSVLAIHNGNAKKYAVPLYYLKNPSFIKLLEKAAEEFEFEHEGALCIPCRWNELDRVLGLDIQ